MLEIPEAVVVARQMNSSIAGKCVENAEAGASPHKFAWFFGDPSEYGNLLQGRTILSANAYAGRVEISLDGGAIMHFGDGAVLKYYEPDAAVPVKHQLMVRFNDGSTLVGTVAMYGGLWAFMDGDMDDNLYYTAAKRAVSPLSDQFDWDFFCQLYDERGLKMSAKAFLATEQRIPGLGNGVLHDILLGAKVHPKRKINTLSPGENRALFNSIKQTLAVMTEQGGRDTERDLFGKSGGYKTKLSKNNKNLICPICGGAVKKETFMGGSIYFCQTCQEL